MSLEEFRFLLERTISGADHPDRRLKTAFSHSIPTTVNFQV